MKTKQDLAKYLANYIEQGLNSFIKVGFTRDTFDYRKVIEQALDAFESTEETVIFPEKQQVIISLWSGLVEVKSRPKNVQVILYDYDYDCDIEGQYELDNPDRIYGEDTLGTYKETEL